MCAVEINRGGQLKEESSERKHGASVLHCDRPSASRREAPEGRAAVSSPFAFGLARMPRRVLCER